tara:strand:- start:683 stop:958 length:276 start_codon:yes stop_codon:yes gene_type:complete
MADEGRLREELDRGQKANDIIRNPVFEETFMVLRQRYTTLWENTEIDEQEEREKLYFAINVLGDIYDHIVSVMQTGEMADRELVLPENSVH